MERHDVYIALDQYESALLRFFSKIQREQVAAFVSYNQLPVRVLSFGIDDVYVKQGSISVLKKAVGLDWESISDKVMDYLGDESRTGEAVSDEDPS